MTSEEAIEIKPQKWDNENDAVRRFVASSCLCVLGCVAGEYCESRICVWYVLWIYAEMRSKDESEALHWSLRS